MAERVQEALGDYEYSYVFSFDNIRSKPFKTMQSEMHESTKFFLGKNKVMIKALGTTPETEVQDNTA